MVSSTPELDLAFGVEITNKYPLAVAIRSLYDLRQANGLEGFDITTGYSEVTALDRFELEGSCDFDKEKKFEVKWLGIRIEDRGRAIVDLKEMTGLLESIERWLKNDSDVDYPSQC